MSWGPPHGREGAPRPAGGGGAPHPPPPPPPDAARVRLTHHYHTRSIQDSDVEALLSATMVAR